MIKNYRSLGTICEKPTTIQTVNKLIEVKTEPPLKALHIMLNVHLSLTWLNTFTPRKFSYTVDTLDNFTHVKIFVMLLKGKQTLYSSVPTSQDV
jgi:hypothetical protein